MDKEYLDKIEELIEERKNEEPIQKEINKLFNEMFPTEQFEKVFRLGYAYALATIKNEMYKYFCKDCREYMDILIDGNKKDSKLSDPLNKLIK